MLRKIDLRRVVIDHYRTLHDNQSGARWPDLVGFAVLPLVIAAVATALGERLGDTGSLLAAVSVLAGLLFALLVMLLQMASAAAEGMGQKGAPLPRTYQRMALMRQMAANVAYAVLVSVLSTVLLGVGQFILDEGRAATPLTPAGEDAQPGWLTLLTIGALLHLVLTLLMVLKRTYTLLMRELDYGSVPAERG